MDNSLIYTNAHPDPQINENRLSDENFINELQKVRQLLEKHFNYGMSGDLYVDLNYVYTIGYDETKCISGGYFCANCIADFLNYKAKCNLIKTQYPFVTYRDKLNFLVKNRDFFVTYDITYVFDNISFSFLPQNEEEVDIFLEFKEKENKEMRLNGQKNIDDLPIVSFGELKCSLFQKAQRSADPKQLIQNEYKQLTALFPKNQTYGPGATFWYIYDLKVNAKNHKHGINAYLDTSYIEFGSLAEHYVNYYFYLNDIIENKQDAFLESLKYVDINLIYFRPNSTVLLSQKESDEIMYSGMYIQDICCLTPIRFIQNIFKDTKITKDEYNIIFSVFTNHGFWDFGELKNNQTNDDPNSSHVKKLIKEIFSISEMLSECRKKFLSEFMNLVIQENNQEDYTLILSEFKVKFLKEYNKIYSPEPAKVSIELSRIDYFLKIIDPDDFRLRNEFGKLSTNYLEKTPGRIEQANLFFIYDKLHDVFIEAKEQIRSKLMSFNDKFNQKIFLEGLKEKLKYTKFYNLDVEIDRILKPIGVSFFELFDTPNKSLQIYQELKDCISLDNSNPESSRLAEQKIDFYHQILFFWRNKGIQFIDDQLKDLIFVNKKIVIGISTQTDTQSTVTLKDEGNVPYEFIDNVIIQHNNDSTEDNNYNSKIEIIETKNSLIPQTIDDLPLTSDFQYSPSIPLSKSFKFNPLIKRFLLTLTSTNWEQKVSECFEEINSQKLTTHDLGDNAAFEHYVKNFSWDMELENVLDIQTNNIVITDNEDDIMFGDEYTIEYRNSNEEEFFKTIKNNKIFFQDLILLKNVLNETKKQLNLINVASEKLLENKFKPIFEKLNVLITPGLVNCLQDNFLNAFSKKDIERISPNLWDNFILLWNENNKKQNTGLVLEKSSKTANKIHSKTTGLVLVQKDILSDQFKNFYYTLFDNGFVGETLPIFRNAFKGDQSFKKVIWLKDQNELNYLIYNLIKKKVIKKYGAWKHINNMFELQNNVPLGKYLNTNFYSQNTHNSLDLAINQLL